MPKKLTQKRLKEVLHYNPETGIFTWRIATAKSIKIGDIAGCKGKQGYIPINVDNKRYYSHRLAWLYIHGYFPEHGLDHKDRIKHHNWIDNLREVSQQCNLRNTINSKNNTSNVKGVHWNKNANKWEARIKVNSKVKYIGIYKSFDEAVCARLAGEQCLDWADCDSSSPAYKYVQEMLKEVS